MREMRLQLHAHENAMVLDWQEIYEYVDENTPEKARFARYVQKWCEYLNYPLYHNAEMAFADADYLRLGAWIEGYEFAKNYRSDRTAMSGHVILHTGAYVVFLTKPFRIRIDGRE